MGFKCFMSREEPRWHFWGHFVSASRRQFLSFSARKLFSLRQPELWQGCGVNPLAAKADIIDRFLLANRPINNLGFFNVELDCPGCGLN